MWDLPNTHLETLKTIAGGSTDQIDLDAERPAGRNRRGALGDGPTR